MGGELGFCLGGQVRVRPVVFYIRGSGVHEGLILLLVVFLLRVFGLSLIGGDTLETVGPYPEFEVGSSHFLSHFLALRVGVFAQVMFLVGISGTRGLLYSRVAH